MVDDWTASPAHWLALWYSGERNSKKHLSTAGGLLDTMMETGWYYSPAEGKSHGPVSLVALCKAISRGQIKSDDLVWHEQVGDWQRVASVPNLVKAIPVRSAPPTCQTDSGKHESRGSGSGTTARSRSGAPTDNPRRCRSNRRHGPRGPSQM